MNHKFVLPSELHCPCEYVRGDCELQDLCVGQPPAPKLRFDVQRFGSGVGNQRSGRLNAGDRRFQARHRPLRILRVTGAGLKKEHRNESGEKGGKGKDDNSRQKLIPLDQMKFNKEQMAMMHLIVRSHLWTVQTLREVICIMYDQYMVERESDLVLAVRKTGRQYSQAVRRAGGTPTDVPRFTSMVEFSPR